MKVQYKSTPDQRSSKAVGDFFRAVKTTRVHFALGLKPLGSHAPVQFLVEKYKPIESLDWSKAELEQGKIIKIKTFPKNKKVKLFRVIVSTEKTEFVATND